MSQAYICLLELVTAVVAINGLGYEHYNCPTPGLNAIDCDTDFRRNHNAKDGVCGNATEGDFFCYCGASKKEKNSDSNQCKAGLLTAQYTHLCQLDCQCNHGGADGTCNFETSACQCSGSATTTSCKFSTLAQYLNKVFSMFEKRLSLVTILQLFQG